MKIKKVKDYYKEIDSVLKHYETKGFDYLHSLSWVADRINWCWKFKKITEEQMEDLCDRTTHQFELGKE